MKLRNLLISLLLTALGFTTAYAQSLVLRHRDGTASVVRVTDSLRMQTTGGNISLISGTDTQTFNNDDILSITYRKGRSDVNRDFKTDISDVVAVINDMAGNGQQDPIPFDADVNGDGKTDISDVVAVINVMAGKDQTPLPVIPAENTNYYSETGNAFYVYRNDGKFNGFLRNDADSISFRNGCQLVHTEDSTYTIPFAAIDSVSFIVQKPVMREGLFFLNDYHAAHITAIDSLTLYFDSGIRADSLPHFGQVVLHGAYMPPFEEGFAGRVKSITRESDLIKIDCDMICIGDVFKHLVLVGEAKSVSADEYAKYKKHSRVSSDPWVQYKDMDSPPILATLPNMKFSFPGDIYTIESIAPRLVVKYTAYVDEWTYHLSATCNIFHDEFINKYTFKIGDLMKLADEGNLEKKDEELLDIMIRQHNYENLSDEDWVNSVLWENKHKGSKEKRSKDDADFLKKLWDKMHWSYSVPVFGPIMLDLEVGPVPLLKGGLDVSYSETSKAHNTFYVETWGNTMVTMAFPMWALATGAAHIKGSTNFHKEEPYKQSLKIKGKGSLNLGIQGSAGFSLFHKSLVHANVHFQAGVRFVGELGMEISNENVADWGWYEAFKDTRIKFEPFFSHGVELGISPWSFLTASFDWEHDLDEFGSVYLFPHFTRPALPEYDTMWEHLDYTGLDPLVLQSKPSEYIVPDCIPFKSCKIGLRIVDEEGNTVRETEEIIYHSDKEEFWKEFQPTISLKGLQAGKKYRCYPVLRYFMKEMWRATPSFEFTVPEKISVSETFVKLNVGETKQITLNGGWGVYKITNDDLPEIVSAKFEDPNGAKSRIGGFSDASGTSGNGNEEAQWGYDGTSGYCAYGEKVFVKGKDENGVNFPVDNLKISLAGKSVGNTTIYLEDMYSGDRLMLKVEVGEGNDDSYLTCPDSNHPHVIDMGEAGKWSCCNVGASAPWEYGGYYAWGETEEKNYYDWSTYIHCDGSSSTCHSLGSDIAGTQYDVAHVKWGGKWRMPSHDQQMLLLDNCTSEWTNVNGINGRKFTAPNGGSIFLPAAGYRWSDGTYDVGSYGDYWSSTQSPNGSYDAYRLYFGSGGTYWDYYGYRSYGQSVRPVTE